MRTNDHYLTFQKFNDPVLAQQMGEHLKEHGIPFVIEDNQKFFDPSFAYNHIEADVSLKLAPQDFTRARQALEQYYSAQLDDVEKDYYLFQFTDEELMEIVSKPDEWGAFDYQLAQKLLRERGKEVQPAVAELLKTQRTKELAKPDTIHRWWIYAGYISAVLGGLFGLIIGATLVFNKKTLPNGEKIFAYDERVRNHGTRILVISAIFFPLWLFINGGLSMALHFPSFLY